jgi:hypothetical protein
VLRAGKLLRTFGAMKVIELFGEKKDRTDFGGVQFSGQETEAAGRWSAALSSW